MPWLDDEDREHSEKAIEFEIYRKASVSEGFAIAYALIQCAAALNGINGTLEAIAIDIDRTATSVEKRD